ncbi:hypothetical protein HK405_000225, partial [Cladochytrium tenue]
MVVLPSPAAACATSAVLLRVLTASACLLLLAAVSAVPEVAATAAAALAAAQGQAVQAVAAPAVTYLAPPDRVAAGAAAGMTGIRPSSGQLRRREPGAPTEKSRDRFADGKSPGNCYIYKDVEIKKQYKVDAQGNPHIDCDQMSALAVSDGLIKTSRILPGEFKAIHEKSPTAKHFVALAVSKNDYHWIRIEEGGQL